ncbi:MAG TPA: hypothetical protein VFN11_16980, partial [Ktedonobacterales bacterium]|nr:hypothetical protein [Ktedonobacterales bacterium]
KQVGMWGGSAISVIGGTKHPKEAEEFVRWYLTNDASLQIGVKEIGWFPSNLNARKYPEVNSPDAYFSNQIVDATFTDITTDPNWTWPPDLTAVNQMMGNDFAAAVANKTPLSGALDQLQQQVVQDLKSQNINVVSS